MNLTNATRWVGRFALAISFALGTFYLSHYLLRGAGLDQVSANAFAAVIAVVVSGWVISS